MLIIDGRQGEGGGQVLRTSLALSLATGTPFRLDDVRGGRAKPGLLRQHLTALRAAAAVGDAEVTGAELGSRRVSFSPRALKGGNYTFSIGSAGSALLVVQTILPALLLAKEPSTVRVTGGTHAPMAPPFDHFARAFVPALARMGLAVEATLHRHGFFPAGGGDVEVHVRPEGAGRVSRFEALDDGRVTAVRARALVAGIRPRVGWDEVTHLAEALALPRDAVGVDELAPERGPGNAVMVEIERERSREIVTAFGEKGVPAKKVADAAAEEARALLAADVPIGEHLADQLLLPMALGRGGEIATVAPSLHTTTQMGLVPRFLPDVRFEARDEGRGRFVITVR